LQNTYAVVPQTGEAQLRVFNGLDCQGSVDVSGIATDDIKPLDFWKAPTLRVHGEKPFPLTIHNDSYCKYSINIDGTVDVTEKKVTCNKYMMRT